MDCKRKCNPRGRKVGRCPSRYPLGLLSNNVIYDIDGCGVAAEDGSESGNLIVGNFVVRVNGGQRRFDGFGLEA